jgi:hypothetical protein
MDQRIKQLRREMWGARKDEDAYLKLVEIDKLQHQRYLLEGAFLPHGDGKIYIYSLEYEKWFQYFPGVK